jgi:hypothetical protein
MSGEVSLEASDCGSGDLVKSGGVWVSTIVTAKGQRLRRLHDEICSTRRRKIGTGGVHVERADAEANRRRGDSHRAPLPRTSKRRTYIHTKCNRDGKEGQHDH